MGREGKWREKCFVNLSTFMHCFAPQVPQAEHLSKWNDNDGVINVAIAPTRAATGRKR